MSNESTNTLGSSQGNAETAFVISSANFYSSFGASSTAVANNEFTLMVLNTIPVSQGNVVAIDYGGLKVSGTSSYQLIEG